MADQKVSLFGMSIDCIGMADAVSMVLKWCHDTEKHLCRYVVTPNADHAVMFQGNSSLRAAYESASMVVADGTPLVWASRLLGKPLPERVAGSDLVPELFESASDRFRQTPGTKRLTVFLLGAGPGVAQRAAQKIEGQWPGVEVVGTDSPPFGFETSCAENSRICKKISEARPDLLLVGLGAPKQEVWVQQHQDKIAAKAALCVGATIDFLAGEKKRSPAWMRQIGMEWFHRMVTEPRRLARRYMRDALVLPALIWQDYRKQKRSPAS